MSWKCYVENYAIQADGIVGINVIFVNEVLGIKVPKQIRTAATSVEHVKDALRAEIAGLSALDVVKDIPLGEIDLTPGSSGPTAEEMARRVFLSKTRTLLFLHDLAQAGVVFSDVFDPLLAEVKTLYKPEYFIEA